MDHLQRTEKELKNIKKLEIYDIYIYIYQNELVKDCFQHNMAYTDFKSLTRRTNSDNILRDKVFSIAKRKVHSPFIDKF